MDEETLPFLLGVLRGRKWRGVTSLLFIYIVSVSFPLVNDLLGEVNQEQTFCFFI